LQYLQQVAHAADLYNNIDANRTILDDAESLGCEQALEVALTCRGGDVVEAWSVEYL